MTFPWDDVYEDIGKVIRFYNSSPKGGGIYTFGLYSWRGAKDGSYGHQYHTYDVVVLPQETVEITNFLKSDNENSYECEWIMTNRFGPENFRETNGRQIKNSGELTIVSHDTSVFFNLNISICRNNTLKFDVFSLDFYTVLPSTNKRLEIAFAVDGIQTRHL